jgi:hypothetical protein
MYKMLFQKSVTTLLQKILNNAHLQIQQEINNERENYRCGTVISQMHIKVCVMPMKNDIKQENLEKLITQYSKTEKNRKCTLEKHTDVK